jgi:polar amino acid transport system permease protein
VITFVGSTPLGILLAVVKKIGLKPVNIILDVYSLIIRGTPLLFQIFFVYYGLPLLWGIRLTPLIAAAITFILSWTAYIMEIVLAALNSVDNGQLQAGQVIGLNYWQIMRKIVLPQAILRSLPALSNQAIEILYATPLLGVIGMDDLLKNAKVFLARDLRLDSFMLAAVIYLILNCLIISSFKRLEKRLARYALNT